MLCEKIDVSVSTTVGKAFFYTYIQEYTESIGIEKRPFVLICPGGAYAYTSDREAEPLALAFVAMGCNAGVLRYSVAPAQFPTAFLELAKSVKCVRDHAEEWHVDPDKILIQGSSAGGHLVASFGCLWNSEFIKKMNKTEKIWQIDAESEEVKTGDINSKNMNSKNKDSKNMNSKNMNSEDIDLADIKPNGLILSYPVITMGEFTHEVSAQNICGNIENAAEFGSNMPIKEYLSLENRVTSDVPPCFIWSTFEDGAVPIENTLMFASALRKAGVNTELHIFAHGGHGLALANGLTTSANGKENNRAVSEWINLVRTWIEENYPPKYVY